MQHYPFGSSTAARTNACPGWYLASKDVPKTESSYAVDGNIIHGMLEQAMLNGEPADYEFGAYTGQTEFGGAITEDHTTMAADMWRALWELLEDVDAGDMEPEVTGVASPEVGGTIDLIVDCGPTAMVIDYKTGRGVQVDPKNNAQLLFATAVCLIDSTGKDLLEGKRDFVGVIIQPDMTGVIQVKTWVYTMEEVEEFWSGHKDNIILAKEPGAPKATGDHCKFCPAAPTCELKTGAAQRALQRNPEQLSTLAGSMAMVEELEAWCKEVRKAVQEQLEVGAAVDGYKLVAKQARGEHWLDEEVMAKRLSRYVGGKKALYTTKPITPAQARTLLKKSGKKPELVDPLAEKNVSSGNTIAPESDPRPAQLSPSALKAAMAAAG